MKPIPPNCFREPPPNPHGTVLAMVPCADVLAAPGGPATIVGATWAVECERFPARFAGFKVYVVITGMQRPPLDLALSWVWAGQLERPHSVRQRVGKDVRSPLDVRDVVFDLTGLPIGGPGRGELFLSGPGAILAKCWIDVTLAVRRQPDGGDARPS